MTFFLTTYLCHHTQKQTQNAPLPNALHPSAPFLSLIALSHVLDMDHDQQQEEQHHQHQLEEELVDDQQQQQEQEDEDEEQEQQLEQQEEDEEEQVEEVELEEDQLQEDDGEGEGEEEEEKEEEQQPPQHQQPPPHHPQGAPLVDVTESSDALKDPEATRPAEHQPWSPSADTTAAMAANIGILSSANASRLDCSLPCDQIEAVLQPCLSAAESRVTKVLQQTVETVQSQILCALHQAALDIIEHLGKEAATRVVVAERKAAVLEQELINVKQQALSMLLRLKCTTDAQILEADKKYLIERRRAQDAEAKLIAVQDTTKRLKGELRRKGEILEKMQKLVQPAEGEQLDQLSGLAECSDRRRTGCRNEVNDLHSKVPQLEADKMMLFSVGSADDASDMKNGSPQVLPYGVYPVNVHPILPTAVQAQNATAEHIAETELERRWGCSAAETISLAEVGVLQDIGVRWQTGRLSKKGEFGSLNFEPKEGHLVMAEKCAEEQDEKHESILDVGGVNSCPCEQAEQAGHANSSPFSGFENKGRQVDQVHNAGVPGSTESQDGIDRLVVPDSHRSSVLNDYKSHEDEDESGTGLLSLQEVSEKAYGVRENLVRTDDGAQGICREEQGKVFTTVDSAVNVDIESECMLKADASERCNMQISDPNIDFCETSGSQTQLGSTTDNTAILDLEGESRKFEKDKLQKHVGDLTIEPELTDSRQPSYTLEDGTPTTRPCASELWKEGKEELLAETVTGGFRTGVPESSACISEGMEPGTASEFMRPDYEVATSLAELAVIAREAGQDSAEASASNMTKDEMSSRPGRLGLRKKRKGAFLEQEDSSALEEKRAKKPREAKGQRGLSDSHTGRMMRKPRLGTSVSQKSSLTVESSRDSRRLMQGARQLFSLSEKKWW